MQHLNSECQVTPAEKRGLGPLVYYLLILQLLHLDTNTTETTREWNTTEMLVSCQGDVFPL